MRIALVSRELYPLSGGGIGAFVASAARLLSRVAEVTVLTTSNHRPVYEQLHRQGDNRLPPPGVRVAFIDEPSTEEASGWYDVVQCYGERVLHQLRELYPDGGPDVLEFPDYLGEGFVTIQAAQALDPLLRGTCICVRLHTTQELVHVLNAHCGRSFAQRARFEMERWALCNADRVIWQGGDILGTYQRYYGRGLAPAARVRYPYTGPTAAAGADAHFRCGSPLRVLYAGRLERRKGVQNLVGALAGLVGADVHLTLVGGDTQTGPLGVSMRDMLELNTAGEPRVELRDQVSLEALSDLIRGHDVVAIPSLWECWPYAALEALSLNRPLLATPVGGLVELVRPGTSGWLADGTDEPALGRVLAALLDQRAELEALVRSGAPRERARQLTDEREILAGYEGLAAVAPRVRRRGARGAAVTPPLVSAIVPYYRSARYVRATIDSLLGQSYPRIEIILANDGSFADEDWALAELAAEVPLVIISQMNSGLGAARNFAISQTQGRYVFPLDADNLAEPSFVSRCVEVLEERQEVAYVTSWSRYITDTGAPRADPDLGYEPLGNWSALLEEDNVGGDAAAVIRRRVFDVGFTYSEELTSFEDWHFYRELARAGHLGAVIPERLLRYRVHDQSMLANIGTARRGRIEGEMRARLRENGVRWKSLSV